MRDAASNLLGVGLYTVPEAARLLDAPTGRVRRWLTGYRYVHAGKTRRAEPLCPSHLPAIDGSAGLTFRDLMELRFFDAFVRAGLSVRALRLSHDRARKEIGHDHPFGTERFRTDGRTVFMKVAEASRERTLLDLRNRQFGIRRMIEPSFKDLDLEHGAVVRWWPLGHDRRVTLDPARAFGRPIDAASGVPTATLTAAAETLGSARAVTSWYPVDARSVRDAVAFERRGSEPGRRSAA